MLLPAEFLPHTVLPETAVRSADTGLPFPGSPSVPSSASDSCTMLPVADNPDSEIPAESQVRTPLPDPEKQFPHLRPPEDQRVPVLPVRSAYCNLSPSDHSYVRLLSSGCAAFDPLPGTPGSGKSGTDHLRGVFHRILHCRSAVPGSAVQSLSKRHSIPAVRKVLLFRLYGSFFQTNETDPILSPVPPITQPARTDCW